VFVFLTGLLSNVWTYFHQIFIDRRFCGVIRYGGTPMKIDPLLQIMDVLSPQIFLGEGVGQPLRGNEEEFGEN